MKTAKACAALALTALLAAASAGCLYINIGDGKTVMGSGRIETLDVPMENAPAGVDNQSSIDVVIDPSLEGKAVIEGDSSLIGYVKLEQDSAGTLYVDYEAGINIVNVNSMTVRIPAPQGGRIIVNGSGDMTQAGGTLTGGDFDVRVNGSGDISLNLEASGLYVDANGSGDADISAQTDAAVINLDGSGTVSLSGSSQTLDLSSTGSGDFNGFDFAVRDASVSLHGSGGADVCVTGALKGDISGSGGITYAGSPASVEVDDNGSGGIHKR